MEHHEHEHPPVAVKKSACSGCEHCHEDSGLPQGGLVAASGILTGIGLLSHVISTMPEWLATAAFAAATVAGGLLVFPAAWGALKKRRLDINVLMAVAVTGAWLIGQGAEAASVVFLFSLSELLESWAAGRARRAVDSLLELSPPTAFVRNADGGEVEMPVAAVEVGAEILIRSGSRIPLDGEVIAGASPVHRR